LYESLTTNVGISWSLQDASTGSRNQFGGTIREIYNKRLGEWGRLTLRATPRIAMAYDRPQGDIAPVFDESHTMADLPFAPRLDNPDVIIETIEVTSEDCSGEVCEPELDYRAIPVSGGFVELRLPDVPRDLDVDSAVLVEYKYELGEEADILNTGVDAEASLFILERLGLFCRYEINDQKLVSGNERNVRINDYDRTVVGMHLTWPWFSATAEFEDYNATFGPFRGYSGSISAFNDSTASWRVGFNAGYTFRDQKDTGETMGLLSLSGTVTKRLFRRGELTLEGRYRQERWTGDRSDESDVDTLFLNAGYSWWYGKVSVKLKGGMAQILRKREDRSVYRVDLRVRRSF
jgi:hypothetical protein